MLFPKRTPNTADHIIIAGRVRLILFRMRFLLLRFYIELIYDITFSKPEQFPNNNKNSMHTLKIKKKKKKILEFSMILLSLDSWSRKSETFGKGPPQSVSGPGTA